jgi:hypothetical protein
MAERPARQRASHLSTRAERGRRLARGVIESGPVIIPGIDGDIAFFDLVAMAFEDALSTGASDEFDPTYGGMFAPDDNEEATDG